MLSVYVGGAWTFILIWGVNFTVVAFCLSVNILKFWHFLVNSHIATKNYIPDRNEKTQKCTSSKRSDEPSINNITHQFIIRKGECKNDYRLYSHIEHENVKAQSHSNVIFYVSQTYAVVYKMAVVIQTLCTTHTTHAVKSLKTNSCMTDRAKLCRFVILFWFLEFDVRIDWVYTCEKEIIIEDWKESEIK